MLSSRRRLRVVGTILALGLGVSPAQGAALDRPADPVVLLGSDVTPLLGAFPGDVVAFRFAGGWEQVPVQVDERDLMPFDRLYHNLTSFGSAITGEFFTDTGTFAEADSDPTLDANDEIALMAFDTGDLPPGFSEPSGVVPGSGILVRVTDSTDGGRGYVYLFRRSGGLDPGAGRQYVSYAFDLLSGDYRSTYRLADGPNPENSIIVTDSYSVHFSDRWIADEMRVFAGGATGADILDRRTNKFAPNACGRSEDTFSDAEGAFYVNKSGPVRALRGYIGANSGPLTQREHVFYAAREDEKVFLRVHPIGGIMNLIDYSPAATGMTYSRNGTEPVVIDGLNDAVPSGSFDWELVTGAQGSVVAVSVFNTDTGISPTSYYLDDVTPADAQCTGDGMAFGSSGLWVAVGIPNTDPRLGTAARFEVFQTFYYDGPGLSAADAEVRNAWARRPLDVASETWSATDSDGDGTVDALDAFPLNATESADADLDGLGDVFERRIIDARSDDDLVELADVHGADDFDGDGVTNALEFVNGTNPIQPDATPMSIVSGRWLAVLMGLFVLASARLCIQNALRGANR